MPYIPSSCHQEKVAVEMGWLETTGIHIDGSSTDLAQFAAECRSAAMPTNEYDLSHVCTEDGSLRVGGLLGGGGVRPGLGHSGHVGALLGCFLFLLLLPNRDRDTMPP